MVCCRGSLLLRSTLVTLLTLPVAVTPLPAQRAEVKATTQPDSAVVTDPAALLVRQVQAEVAEIRGLEFRQPVPAHTVDDNTAREHLLRRLELFDFDERLQLATEAYGLLGLLEPEEDVQELVLAALREQVGGFYDPQTKALFLLDDMPEILTPILAAHELTHALEDQHFDLDARLIEVQEDDDRLFARSAVHEGSATLVMGLYAARAVMRGQLDPLRLQQANEEFAQGQAVGGLPQVLLRGMLGPYVLGAQFLTRGNPAALAAGFPGQDVRQVYASGPSSSEQILHPEKYWDPERFDAPASLMLGAAGNKLGRGWSRSGGGVLGELLLALLVDPAIPSEPTALLLAGARAWTHPAAAGWDGDRWELWANEERRALLLSTVWDTPEDAREFAAALDGKDGFAIRVAGSTVALVAGDPGRRSRAVLAALLKSARVVPGGAEGLE